MLRAGALTLALVVAVSTASSHSHGKGPKPPKPSRWDFGCESNCVECVGREVLSDGTQRVVVDASSCKGSCLSWLCARNDGAVLEECAGECSGSKGKSGSHSHSRSRSRSGSHSHSRSRSAGRQADVLSHSHSHSKGGKGGKGGKGHRGPKCEGATGGTFVIPGDQGTLTLQVHDGRQEGNFFCGKGNKADCCGGCGKQGCCNHEVDLSTCPTMAPPPTQAPPPPTRPPTPPPTRPPTPPPCLPCGTTPASVKTIGPDGTTVADDALPMFPLENFMPAWKSCGEQMYIYDCLPPPPTRAFFPAQDQGIPEDSTLRVECPCNPTDSPCEVIVTQYHCPGCSTYTNGGFPQTLPPLGWRAGSCAPLLSASPSWDDADGWKSLGFRKLVAAGTVEEIPVVGSPAEHVGVFVRQCAVDCSALSPDDGMIPDECVCEGMTCRSAWCPPRLPPVTPPPECNTNPGCASSCALDAVMSP